MVPLHKPLQLRVGQQPSKAVGPIAQKIWMLASADGTIITAHCMCITGVGKACSRVGAALFAIDTAVRIRDAKTCTERGNIWLPAHNPRAECKRLRDIDFSSAQAKKKQLDSASPG
ncbi:hypothetical protein HPB49_012027 [Dermacentor silvarum]|uniref:Uncharacterized protein n=1 Tax=Dermacentor silvarum TaxID=543639 RepID=A0ACB8DCV0_DERSI|nr:hypothetical protein HPB49_012027 [Dermacentor silvarum]